MHRVSELDLLMEVATPDISSAMSWLLAEGAKVTRKEDPHGMAFALAEFALDDAAVRIVRDRGCGGWICA